jgi:hypothetical protein
MDFSTDDVILNNPITPTKSDGKLKTIQVECQLMITKADADYNPPGPGTKAESEYYFPVGVKGTNTYQIRELLEFGAIFPNGSHLNAHSKLYYPDKVGDIARKAEFSAGVLSRHPESALRKTSWIGASVISLVTAREPEDIIDAMTLIKSLDGEIIKNTLGESARVKIKEREPFVVPAAEMPLLKGLLKGIIEKGHTAVKEEDTSLTPFAKTFNIVGVKRMEPEPAKASRKK